MFKTRSKLSISGFFPFLNDWGPIGSLVATLDQTLQKISSDYEIIIVDDGSDYRSKEVLVFLKRKYSNLRVVTHARNRGYGGAVKSGIKNSKKEWIFYTDGDAQYDPRELLILIKHLKPGIDIVNGYKIKRSDPWYRVVVGRIYHYVVKILFNIPIRDTDCDFRLMRREIFDVVDLESDSGVICAEMIKKISDFGFKFAEAPIHHYLRTSGKSQFFNFYRAGKVVIDLLGLWYKLVIKKDHLRHASFRNLKT